MEALVRIVDRSSAEDDAHRGDVVETHPDGWAWSQAELTNPDWIIIQISGFFNTDSDAALATARKFPAGRFRRREWKLDLDNAPFPSRFAWPRKTQKVTMTRLAVVSILVQKPAMV